MSHSHSPDKCVTFNARIRGRISKRSRQVDASIDARHCTQNLNRLIVDAKLRKRKVDIKDVEAFRGLMEDVGAAYGYLVCSAGFTKSAERRAQDLITVTLVPPEEYSGFDPSKWPPCEWPGCSSGSVFWDGGVELFYTPVYQGVLAVPAQKKSAKHFLGKCDHCGKFHVRCSECEITLVFDEADGEHQCSCKPPWFWLASVEADEAGRRSAELHNVSLLTGRVTTLNRRPID